MQTVTGSQRTGLLKMTIRVRLPGCMPICIDAEGDEGNAGY